MKDEIARLKKSVYTAQMNFWVEEELKARFRVLKEVHGIDVAEEGRKALYALADRLERAVAKTA
jgi:hypothetical protein